MFRKLSTLTARLEEGDFKGGEGEVEGGRWKQTLPFS
jgi:hypothetical protein